MFADRFGMMKALYCVCKVSSALFILKQSFKNLKHFYADLQDVKGLPAYGITQSHKRTTTYLHHLNQVVLPQLFRLSARYLSDKSRIARRGSLSIERTRWELCGKT